MKKNIHFRRTPDYIEQELLNIESRHVVVAAIINTSYTKIDQGEYHHLGIKIHDGELNFPEIIFPEMITGLYARRNRNGITWILKNLPKINKTYSWEAPDFGDPSRGYHTVFMTRKVYLRRLEPPRDWEIKLSVIKLVDENVSIKAEIDTVLDRQHPDFRNDLFFAINLLQEQCGDCHVFDSGMSDEELTRITTVGWEIFPPGTMDRDFTIITRRLRNRTPERQKEIQRRAKVFQELNPSEYILGSGMNSHYFGAKFGDSIVVFENLDYGNALYILVDNWQEISKMSRVDILKRHKRDFVRIIHKKGWEKALRRNLNNLRGL